MRLKWIGEHVEIKRLMKCPYCGHEHETGSIGAVYCGPHVASFGSSVSPAVRMIEVRDDGEAA